MKHEFKTSPKVDGVPQGRSTIRGSARIIDTHRQIVQVVDPDGKVHEHTRENARFLVRERKWKWPLGIPPRSRGMVKLVDGTIIEEQLKDEVDGEDSNIKARTSAAKKDSPEEGADELGFQAEFDPAAEALTQLRSQAEGLGIKVDKRWGKKKLQQKIDDTQ